MKKFILLLIATTAVLSAQVSATENTALPQSTKEGAYVGVGIGYGATKARVTAPPNGGTTGLNNTSTGLSNSAANFSLYSGYGWVQNQIYWGGEVGYAIDNTDIYNTYNLNNSYQSLRRSGFFSGTFRLGYLYTPTTMVYARLGMIKSNWKAIDSVYTYGPTLIGSMNRPSLAVGLGFELDFTQEFSGRIEFIQNFVPSVTAINPTIPASFVKFDRIINQSVMLGVSRKF